MKQEKCPACNGKCWHRYYDHRFHSSTTAECPIAVCPLCAGTGLMPHYPEFQPARPPSHYLQRTGEDGPSGCLNAAMEPCWGHSPCTAMISILKMLVASGDIWRPTTVEEVMAFDELAMPGYVERVLPFAAESRGVATFCREWRQVFEWEDSLGSRMKRRALAREISPPPPTHAFSE